MDPANLTQQLIAFLQSVNLPFTTGNWTCKNRGVITKRNLNGNIIDYRVDLENSKTLDVFRIRIWFNRGRITNGFPAHNPPHWFLRVTNLTRGIEIHNIDIEIEENYEVFNANLSKIKESYKRLGGANIALLQNLNHLIATIDSTIKNWEALAIKDILDHEVEREKVKESII